MEIESSYLYLRLYQRTSLPHASSLIPTPVSITISISVSLHLHIYLYLDLGVDPRPDLQEGLGFRVQGLEL